MIKSFGSISAVLLSLLLTFSSCSSNSSPKKSQSQSVNRASGAAVSQVISDSAEEEPPPTDEQAQQAQAMPQSSDTQINTSRQTAITRAVKQVSPAVVSITVTEMVQGGRRLAFDKFYNQFFSVPTEREVSSM